MADELPPEQKATYSVIIDDILATSDLNTISAKRIRKGLQEKVEYDITPQKQAITALIMERFDKVQNSHENSVTSAPVPTVTSNGVTSSAPPKHPTDDHHSSFSTSKRKAVTPPDDDMSDVVDDSPPTKKLKKTKQEIAESDEQMAKRLAAELNAPSRSTRGGGVKKRPAAKKDKTAKKKSKAKIGSEDDSDIDGEDGKPEKERKGGFHKPMTLSEPLSAMLDGVTALSRPQTVKQIWAYVKSRDLQDPSDKRQIRCDDAMRAVFKQDKVHMFTMNKLLAAHLYAQDE